MDAFRTRVKRELAKQGGGKPQRRRIRGGADADDSAVQQRHAEYARKVDAAKAAAARDGKDYAALLTADKAAYLRQAGALNEPVKYATPPVGVPIPTRDGGTRTLNADGTVTYQGSPEQEAEAEQERAAFQAQTNQWAQDRVDEGRRLQQENESGFRKFARGATDAAIKVADFGVKYVPGLNQTVGQVYKAFAPPGSEYYHAGSAEDKAKEAATNVALGAISGGLLGGGDDETPGLDRRQVLTQIVLPTWARQSREALEKHRAKENEAHQRTLEMLATLAGRNTESEWAHLKTPKERIRDLINREVSSDTMKRTPVSRYESIDASNAPVRADVKEYNTYLIQTARQQADLKASSEGIKDDAYATARALLGRGRRFKS